MTEIATIFRKTQIAILKFCLVTFARLFGPIIPKDSGLVIFGSMNGGAYGDNSAHLIEWMLDHVPEVRTVWITRSRSVRDDLEKKGLPVLIAGSFRGTLALLRAKIGVFTNSLSDLAAYPEMVPASIKLIALRHGQPIKRLRFARNKHKMDRKEDKARTREGSLISYAASTSEFISDIQEKCLLIGRHKHIVTGYPRNDNLIDIPEKYHEKWSGFLHGYKPSKVVLYALTWRYGRAEPIFFPFEDFNHIELTKILKKHNTILLLRPHIRDLDIYPELRSRLEAFTGDGSVRLATHHEIMDVNTMLPFIDVMISDYSSIYHDFLLLDRPLMFTPYDYREFEQQQGFLYDYFKTLPGPAVYNFRDFVDELDSALSGKDKHTRKRAALIKKVHRFQDAKARKRVSELVVRALHET